MLMCTACCLADFISHAPDPQETLSLPKDVELWSLTKLKRKLVKIGAKVGRHGRFGWNN